MDIGAIKLTAMEREVIEEDTWTMQTSNGALYYWKFSSPKRLSAKTKTEPKLEVDDSFSYYGSIDNDLFFVSEGKMHKSVLSESDGISLTYVRDKLENEQWFDGCLCSIEREGKQYVYRMCDDPIKDAILVDANLEDWEGITLIGINRGTIIYRKVSPYLTPVVKRIGNNTLVILWKKDNVTVSSCPANSCVYFSAIGDARLYTLETETLEILPPVQIEGVSCISHISGVSDDVVTVNDKCLKVSAKLPKTFEFTDSSDNCTNELFEQCCCSICNEDYDATKHIPRILDCGHTFCQECIGKLLIKNNIKCPMCAVVLFMPEGRILPKNFTVINMAENMRKTRVDAKSRCEIACKICGKKFPTTTIRMCTKEGCNMFGQFLCSDCSLDGGHGSHVVKYDVIMDKMRNVMREELTKTSARIEKRKKDVRCKADMLIEMANTHTKNLMETNIPEHVASQLNNLSSVQDIKEYREILNDLAKTILNKCDSIIEVFDTALQSAKV